MPFIFKGFRLRSAQKQIKTHYCIDSTTLHGSEEFKGRVIREVDGDEHAIFQSKKSTPNLQGCATTVTKLA